MEDHLLKKLHGVSRDSSSRSSSSSSRNDWTDEEMCQKETSNNTKKKRSSPPKKFRTNADYNRYDRPDMFVNELFHYMGTHLAPDTTRRPKVIPAFKLPNKNAKILRLSVEGGVLATGAEVFGTLQKAILESENPSQLPSTVNLKGQSLSLDYASPHGDELLFGSHSQDSSWIGRNFLGSVFVAPSRPSQEPKCNLKNVHDWQFEWSYKSWHRPRPTGVLKPPPHLSSIPTRHNRQRNGKKIDDITEIAKLEVTTPCSS